MLVHQLSGGASGKFEELKNEYSNMVEFMEIIKKTYLTYGNISSENLNDLLKQDLWLNSAKSLEYGFIDEIIKSPAPARDPESAVTRGGRGN